MSATTLALACVLAGSGFGQGPTADSGPNLVGTTVGIDGATLVWSLGYARALWTDMAALGWAGIPFAEELGGLMITSDAWHQSDTHWAAFAEAMAPKCTAEAFIDYCVNPGPYAWQGQCLGITTIIPDFCIVVDPSHACYYEYAQCNEVPFMTF